MGMVHMKNVRKVKCCSNIELADLGCHVDHLLSYSFPSLPLKKGNFWCVGTSNLTCGECHKQGHARGCVHYTRSTCRERPIFESRRSDPVVGLVVGAPFFLPRKFQRGAVTW